MTVKRFSSSLALILIALSINSAQALPIDWTGVFGVDTHLLTNYRRTNDKIDPANKAPLAGANRGTQGIASGDNGASFQTYVFKLNPNIIVNDGVTLKGELSSGYLRGGFAGDEAGNTADGSRSNSYFFTSPAQRSGLNVNQMYMELYADTALIKAGRFSKHYGLGMTFDAGNDAWDRFFTMYDGVEAEMKIGNFSLIPYYAKISSYDDDNLTARPDGARPAGGWDVKEMGMTAKYDNKNRDLIVSLMYGKRFSETRNSLYNTATGAGTPGNGKTSVTVIEPFVSKKWNKFTIAAEASLQTGDYGTIYRNTAVGTNSKLSGSAYIVEAKYDLNPKWDMGINVGQVSGDDANSNKFEAVYLHPNYHIADLMFRYNYPSFNEGGRSVFDASITNAQFFKFYGNYKSDKWTWKGAFVLANALETASSGGRGYHHEENYDFTTDAGSSSQSKDYGYEVDLGFDYLWNPNVTIGAYYGYWFVGDYYSYNGGAAAASDLSISNVHGGGMRATLEF